MSVYRVATKGQEAAPTYWVTSYYVAFSSDGSNYVNYTQGQNRARVSTIFHDPVAVCQRFITTVQQHPLLMKGIPSPHVSRV